MPWMAPVVAHVDPKGRFWCEGCRERVHGEETPATWEPMYGDNSAVLGQMCETCGTEVVMTPTSGYVPVSWDRFSYTR